MYLRFTIVICSLLASWLPLAESARAQASFETISLDFSFDVQPWYMLKTSGDGRVVVGRNDGTAARWSVESGVDALGSLPSTSGQGGFAYGISNDGTTAVGEFFGDNPYAMSEAVVYRSDGTVLPIASDLVGHSIAFDVSGDGDLVVGSHIIGTSVHGFIWDEINGRRFLRDLANSTNSFHAAAVSDDGAMVTGWVAANSYSPEEAYRYSDENGLEQLGLLPNGSRSRGDAISADGSTIVGQANDESAVFAMKWTEAGGMVSLGALRPRPGSSDIFLSRAYGVSANGSVIVGESLNEAFVYADHLGGMVAVRDLLVSLGVQGLEGWDLTRAIGISADGRTLTGWGSNGGGVLAWRAVIPEPSMATLLGLGLLGLAGKRSRSLLISGRSTSGSRTRILKERFIKVGQKASSPSA